MAYTFVLVQLPLAPLLDGSDSLPGELTPAAWERVYDEVCQRLAGFSLPASIPPLHPDDPADQADSIEGFTIGSGLNGALSGKLIPLDPEERLREIHLPDSERRAVEIERLKINSVLADKYEAKKTPIAVEIAAMIAGDGSWNWMMAKAGDTWWDKYDALIGDPSAGLASRDIESFRAHLATHPREKELADYLNEDRPSLIAVASVHF